MIADFRFAREYFRVALDAARELGRPASPVRMGPGGLSWADDCPSGGPDTTRIAPGSRAAIEADLAQSRGMRKTDSGRRRLLSAQRAIGSIRAARRAGR